MGPPLRKAILRNGENFTLILSKLNLLNAIGCDNLNKW